MVYLWSTSGLLVVYLWSTCGPSVVFLVNNNIDAASATSKDRAEIWREGGRTMVIHRCHAVESEDEGEGSEGEEDDNRRRQEAPPHASGRRWRDDEDSDIDDLGGYVLAAGGGREVDEFTWI